MASATFAHEGQHRLNDGDRAEHIDLELLADLRQRYFLDGALQTVAGVVDHHANRPELVLDLRDAALHRALVGDIHQHAISMTGLELLERGFRLGVSHGTGNLVALFQKGFRQCAAETAANACNEPN